MDSSKGLHFAIVTQNHPEILYLEQHVCCSKSLFTKIDGMLDLAPGYIVCLPLGLDNVLKKFIEGKIS